MYYIPHVHVYSSHVFGTERYLTSIVINVVTSGGYGG